MEREERERKVQDGGDLWLCEWSIAHWCVDRGHWSAIIPCQYQHDYWFPFLLKYLKNNSNCGNNFLLIYWFHCLQCFQMVITKSNQHIFPLRILCIDFERCCDHLKASADLDFLFFFLFLCRFYSWTRSIFFKKRFYTLHDTCDYTCLSLKVRQTRPRVTSMLKQLMYSQKMYQLF